MTPESTAGLLSCEETAQMIDDFRVTMAHFDVPLASRLVAWRSAMEKRRKAAKYYRFIAGSLPAAYRAAIVQNAVVQNAVTTSASYGIVSLQTEPAK